MIHTTSSGTQGIANAKNAVITSHSIHYTKLYDSLIPFFIINGILTSLPVVEYHPDHILNIRIFSIPVEDAGYFFLLLLMNTTIYENLREQKYF